MQEFIIMIYTLRWLEDYLLEQEIDLKPKVCTSLTYPLNNLNRYNNKDNINANNNINNNKDENNNNKNKKMQVIVRLMQQN